MVLYSAVSSPLDRSLKALYTLLPWQTCSFRHRSRLLLVPSILAMQQLRNEYSLTFLPLSIARYSVIQLSRLRRREMKENDRTSKRYQRGFEPGLSRLRVRHSTNWATALLHDGKNEKAHVIIFFEIYLFFKFEKTPFNWIGTKAKMFQQHEIFRF